MLPALRASNVRRKPSFRSDRLRYSAGSHGALAVRLTLIALIAALAMTAPVAAQSRFAAPQPQPSAESALPQKPVPKPIPAVASVDAAHAESQAQIDRFEHRLATRSDRAIRSICSGCVTTATRAKRPPQRVEANAETQDLPIDDPAQAPID